jgi:4-amino-4-deoxy-L-arabinose transferase-like glycosyltransferase
MRDTLGASSGRSVGGVSSRQWLLWGTVAVLAVWFLTLDARHLLRSDEGRYAEIAREMFASGDWVTIRYNGLKYFEKPPFHMWMTAIAYHLFGVGDWQSRLWVAVNGVFGLGMTVLAARRWYGPRVALLSGLVLLSTPTWNLGGHFNSLDMSVAGALAGVLAGVLMAQHPLTTPRARSAWMLFAWAMMGVAVLTKGLIGVVLPGLVLVVYSALSGQWALWRRLNIASGLLCFLVITAPWFVLVSMRNPEFPQFFFIHEHWQRYTSTVHHRSAPWWYFLPQLLVGFLPWLGLAWRMGVQVKQEPKRPELRPALLLSVWAGAIFVFFSLSGSKLPGYIIPIFPALAVLAALALDKIDAAYWKRYLTGMLLVSAALLLASPLVGRLQTDNALNSAYRGFSHWIIAAGVLALAGLWAARRLNVQGSPMASISVAAVAVFVATTVALVGHEKLGRGSSGVDLVPATRAVLTPEMPIYSVRLLDHTLPFYLRRTTIMVEAPDELEFGTEQEPAKWMPTVAAFRTAWSSGQKSVAVMSHETFKSLRDDHVVMYPVAQDFKRVVVSNFKSESP